jgi:uncharacterized phage protein gp47/JayE
MLTSQGFKRKRYADLLPEIEEQAKTLFGANVNLSERSPLGKFIQLQAYQRAEDYEVFENLYNSRNVDTSEGVALDQNVKRALITRKEWRKASGIVRMNLAQGAVIPIGTLFAKSNGVQYRTLEEVEATSTGDFLVDVESLEYGQLGNAEANEITIILNPITGLNSVTNPEGFTDGQDEETDAELRKRYYESLGKLGNRRTETIRAAVLDEIEGVRACLVVENDKMTTDADGRPAKSFETIVLGGERTEIAQVIKERKPDGIQAYGTEVVQVTDSQGTVLDIGFSFASVISIYVKAQVNKSTSYPLDGDEQIKQKITEFIGGTHNNTLYHGLNMSDDVVVSKLESRLFAVSGVEDVKVSLSLDDVTYSETNIPIGFGEVAEVAVIEVTDLV